MMKRVLLVSLLSIVMIMLTDAQSDAQSKKMSHFQINPFTNHRITESDFIARKSKSKAATYECTSYNELVSVIIERSKLRDTTYSIHLSYDYLYSNVRNIITQAIYDAMISDDYLLFSYNGYRCEWIGSNGDTTIDFQFMFHTTLANEQYVTWRVAEVLGQIITDGMTDLEKEKAVYDWIIRNVQYDYSFSHYSAYDGLFLGTTVCNGYALLMYRMLSALGMTVRIAPGYGYDELHAWNMVYLCGNWYHADATWDDPNTANDLVNYNYFNLSDAEIISANHTIGADPELYTNVPVAPASFDELACGQYTRPGSNPDTPFLVSPLADTTEQSLTPTLLTGAFSDPDPLNTHLKTLWQISLDAVFSNCIYYDTSTEDLTAFSIPAAASLPDNTTLFWRVRFFDSDLNASDWSQAFSFSTQYQNSPPQSPALNFPVDGLSSVSIRTNLITEPFIDADRWDTHAQTQWQLSTTSNFSVLFFDETSDSSLVKLSFTDGNTLPEFTTFYWRVRYFDSSGGASGWSETRSFTTAKGSPTTAPTTNDGGGSGCFISSSWN